MPPIYECVHCSARVSGSGRFCKDCKTADQRRDMDEANREHFKKELGIEYHCKFCEGEVEKRLKKKEYNEKFVT